MKSSIITKIDCLKEKKIWTQKRKYLNASFTVEASVIIPIIFFVIAFGLQVAMDQYQVIQSLSKEPTKLEAVESVKVMRESDRILKGLKNEN